MMTWPDGARRLIGDDGIVVHIEPTLWQVPSDTIAYIDRLVPADRIIRMPARTPDQIPQPPEPQAPAAPATTGGVWSRGQLIGLILSLIAGVMMLCLGALFVVAANQETPDSPDKIGWGPAIFSAVCTGILFLPAILILVKRRRR